MINLAIPDGHQMKHVLKFFDNIGLCLDGYNNGTLNRRPLLPPDRAPKMLKSPESIYTKVIRPQDMPTHVASNDFDLGITGTDWLKEHTIRFPLSPVEKLLGLGFGKVRIVAALHESLPVYSIEELRNFLSSFTPLDYFRIASEYTYIADDYARRKKLHKYRVIMTYGATESLIPEDAEMILENTETGSTLRKNRLRIIDTLFESEGCLIVNKNSLDNKEKKGVIESLCDLFQRGLT